MAPTISIRPARTDEQTVLELLQRRASLSNPGDRDALLANPGAIALPLEQITDGRVFVAERDGTVVGPRLTGICARDISMQLVDRLGLLADSPVHQITDRYHSRQ